MLGGDILHGVHQAVVNRQLRKAVFLPHLVDEPDHFQADVHVGGQVRVRVVGPFAVDHRICLGLLRLGVGGGCRGGRLTGCPAPDGQRHTCCVPSIVRDADHGGPGRFHYHDVEPADLLQGNHFRVRGGSGDGGPIGADHHHAPVPDWEGVSFVAADFERRRLDSGAGGGFRRPCRNRRSAQDGPQGHTGERHTDVLPFHLCDPPLNISGRLRPWPSSARRLAPRQAPPPGCAKLRRRSWSGRRSSPGRPCPRAGPVPGPWTVSASHGRSHRRWSRPPPGRGAGG